MNCPEINEIQKLAIERSRRSEELGAFLRHSESCERCRLLWSEISSLQKEINSSLENGIDEWERLYFKALASGDVVVLKAVAPRKASEGNLSAVTKIAADDGDYGSRKLREFSVFVSNDEQARLRILLDEAEDRLHFYVSQPSKPGRIMGIFFPEAKEFVTLDESGYGTTPRTLMSRIPSFALLGPILEGG